MIAEIKLKGAEDSSWVKKGEEVEAAKTSLQVFLGTVRLNLLEKEVVSDVLQSLTCGFQRCHSYDTPTYIYIYICVYIHMHLCTCVLYSYFAHIYMYVIVTYKASDCRTTTVAELVFQSANCVQQVVQQSCKNLPGLLGLVGSNLLASNTLKLCTHSNNCCEKKQGPS